MAPQSYLRFQVWSMSLFMIRRHTDLPRLLDFGDIPPKYITLSRPDSGHEPDAKRRFFQPRHTYITGLRQALQPTARDASTWCRALHAMEDCTLSNAEEQNLVSAPRIGDTMDAMRSWTPPAPVNRIAA